jgi:hypothetical protein
MSAHKKTGPAGFLPGNGETARAGMTYPHTTNISRRDRRQGAAPAVALFLLSLPCMAQSVAPTPARGPVPASDLPAPQPPATNPLPPTGVEEELDLIRPGIALKRAVNRLTEKTNLQIGIANTYLFQHASAGPGDRDAGGGDLDLYAKWTAIGAGTKDTGILAFAGEYRYQIGSQAPAALGGQIGTLLGTTNGFGERPPIVKELYWDQRLIDDHLRFVVGRVDPENLFGGHKLQSANLYFFNKAFSTNPTIAFPGPGAAAAIGAKPVSWFYANGGLTDANGNATTSNIEGFFEDDEYLAFAEAGLTPTFDEIGAGRYRLALWHRDGNGSGRPSDEGVTVSCDQDFGQWGTVFARYGHADGDVTNVTDSVQAGVGIKDVLGPDNFFGIAGGWSEPADEGLRAEKVIEGFQRFQVTETVQITVGAQWIIDPSNAPGDDNLAVFSARLRFSF